MKRTNRFLEERTFISDYDYDYKLEYVEQEAQRDFETTDKWLYIGADSTDGSFAKIGMTMGNLASRSSSSCRPSYYLFCAFKFKHNISVDEVKRIESNVLSEIDYLHRNNDGTSKRMAHCESRSISECFYHVDFLEFYRDVHKVIYERHRSSFVILNYQIEFGMDDCEYVDCLFNEKLVKDKNKYIKMILQCH